MPATTASGDLPQELPEDEAEAGPVWLQVCLGLGLTATTCAGGRRPWTLALWDILLGGRCPPSARGSRMDPSTHLTGH